MPADRPYVVAHLAVSLDGATTGFPIDVGAYYALVPTWKEDVTLTGADTILAQEGALGEDGPGPSHDGPLLAVVDSRSRVHSWSALRDCGRRCVYCAAPLDFDIATIDHVFPLARGGIHAPGNLVAACGRCNRLKGDMLPTEFFARYPWAGLNFIHYARAVHRALKRCARRAVSLAYAAAA